MDIKPNVILTKFHASQVAINGNCDFMLITKCYLKYQFKVDMLTRNLFLINKWNIRKIALKTSSNSWLVALDHRRSQLFAITLCWHFPNLICTITPENLRWCHVINLQKYASEDSSRSNRYTKKILCFCMKVNCLQKKTKLERNFDTNT